MALIKVTTGASNDIERATEIARKMVTQWGLSEKMGPLLYAEDENEVFLGRQVTQHKHMSDDTARAIDQEVKSVIDQNYQRAKTILEENIDILHAMKDALVKYETIDAGQIDYLLNRLDVRPPIGWVDRDDNDNGTNGGSAEKAGEEERPDRPINVDKPGDATS